MSWMTQAEAAVALHCSIRTVRRRIRSRSLDARREGRNVYVKIDPDDRNLSISPLARRWSEFGDSGLSHPPSSAEAISSVASTAKDAIETINEFRSALETEMNRVRQSRRRSGWIIVAVLLLSLGALGWLYNDRGVAHLTQVHGLQQGLADAEARGRERVTAVEERHKGESGALWTSLTFARSRVEEVEQRDRNLVKELSVMSAAAEQSDNTIARLESGLRSAERAAKLAGTLRALWTAASIGARGMMATVEEKQSTEEARTAESNHQSELSGLRVRYEAKLAESKGRYEAEVKELRSAIAHEWQNVVHMEERIASLTDKLVPVATDRGRIRLEQVRLAAEVERLEDELRQARKAADLASALRSVWSVLHVGFAGAEPPHEIQTLKLSDKGLGPRQGQ